MSPLARLLLAVACAALLRASCGNYCATDTSGKIKGKEIILPLIKVFMSGDFEIPNYCESMKMVLQGENATACDWALSPVVVVGRGAGAGGATVRVARNNPLFPGATLAVRQYCNT